MMSIDQIRIYMHRINVTQDEVAKCYQGENKKGVTRNYIVQLLNKDNTLNKESYRKLIEAINEAHAIKFNQHNSND